MRLGLPFVNKMDLIRFSENQEAVSCHIGSLTAFEKTADMVRGMI